MTDKNIFGGGNKNSTYTPMSEIEQECILRLIESKQLIVNIVEWGYVEAPKAKFGDLRFSVEWRMNFNKPETPMPVHYFDLELKTRSGILLYKERQSTLYGGEPLMVAAGMYIDLVWDIAITAMDPKIVKQIMPMARGLTSRWHDRDTGDLTLFGNTKMSEKAKEVLVTTRTLEHRNKKDTEEKTQKAERKAKGL